LQVNVTRTVVPGCFSTVGPGLLQSGQRAKTTIQVSGGLIVIAWASSGA
jgi:hypothetical protein